MKTLTIKLGKRDFNHVKKYYRDHVNPEITDAEIDKVFKSVTKRMNAILISDIINEICEH